MQRLSKLIFGFSALGIFLVALAFPLVAHAQTPSTTSFNAAISPLPILLNAKPGTSVSTTLRVNNPGSQDEQFKTLVKTFTQEGPDGNVVLHDPTSADTYLSWISFDRTVFDAPPGLWQTVKMTVNVPKSAAFGYYFAVEFANAKTPDSQAASNGAKIQGGVASFVLLNANVPGEVRQMQVTSFTADHRIYEFLPANFTVHLHNSGNVYGTAAGNIFIMRGSKQVANLVVNGTHGLVLPNSNRAFTASWSDGFPVYKPVLDAAGQPIKGKDGQPEQKLSWNFSQAAKLRFGHYTANLTLVYNDGTRDIPITGSVSFWVVPWRIIGIIAAVLLLIAGLIAYVIVLRRRLKKTKTASSSSHKKAKP